MPKRKTKVEVAETEEFIAPSRTPHLIDNPYASLSKDEAQRALRERLILRDELEYEIDQLRRIVTSFNVAYYDRDGRPRLAE